MKIVPVAQGSFAWLEARAGIVTASELGNLLTPEFKPRTGETPKTYLAEKLAEKWTGEALPGFTSFATDFGKIVEEEAAPWFEFTYDCEVKRGLYLTTDDGKFGCSPDGIIDGKTGLEIKCPQLPNHFKWLLDGKVPKDHLVQVHASLYATGFKEWIFLSYRRHAPPMVVKVARDEAIIKQISEVVADFNAKLDAALRRLKDMRD